jgi:DNA-binding IclR family transcriptional regulator
MKSENGNDAGSTVKSVRTALILLGLVGAARGGARVTDLAEKSGIGKASVSKMLSTLAAEGYVRRDPVSRTYFLGYKLLELSTTLIEGIDIRRVARPALEALESAVNEVINLATYHNGDLIYIDKYEGTKSLRMHSVIGGRAGWTYTSVGKAVFAFLPAQEQAYILDSLSFAPRTPASITSRAAYLAETRDAGRLGYALDLEENVEGIVCVGAPVFDYSGKVVGGVSISTPTVRSDRKRLEELAALLVKSCGEISRALGQQGAHR